MELHPAFRIHFARGVEIEIDERRAEDALVGKLDQITAHDRIIANFFFVSMAEDEHGREPFFFFYFCCRSHWSGSCWLRSGSGSDFFLLAPVEQLFNLIGIKDDHVRRWLRSERRLDSLRLRFCLDLIRYGYGVSHRDADESHRAFAPAQASAMDRLHVKRLGHDRLDG